MMDEFPFTLELSHGEKVAAMANYATSVFNMTVSSESESGMAKRVVESYASDIPSWTAWLSTAFLILSSLFGLPLNATTVLIFWRRKKLRHLVNFVLLLDCLAHILLCLLGVPIHITQLIWMSDGMALEIPGSCEALLNFQQVVTTFTNLCGLFLAVSIAILRYRRLCWKKKDKFSRSNAVKWTFMPGLLTVGFSTVESGNLLMDQPLLPAFSLFTVKTTVVLLSVAVVSFCYIRVAQKVWSSDANSQENMMDVTKLKKIRGVHVRAIFHSVVQIVLLILTLSPYLYLETTEMFKREKKDDDGSCSYKSGVGSTHNQSQRLLTITINYILLIFGTPLAYIASCHRFREQFTSILSDIFGHSPGRLLYALNPNPNTNPNRNPNPEQNLNSQMKRKSSGSLFGRNSMKSQKQDGQQQKQQEEQDKSHPDGHNCPLSFNFSRPLQTHNCQLTTVSMLKNEKKRNSADKKSNENGQMKNLQVLQNLSSDNSVVMLLLLSQQERENGNGRMGMGKAKAKVKARVKGTLSDSSQSSSSSSFDRQNSILDTLRPMSCIQNAMSSSSVSSSSTSTSPSTSTCASNSNSNFNSSASSSQEEQNHGGSSSVALSSSGPKQDQNHNRGFLPLGRK